MNALCGNPDCAAFFDLPPVPHLDRETKLVVLLCQPCTNSFAKQRDGRYIEVDPPQIKPDSSED